MDISHKIASARKKKGLTQEELADRTNVTVRTIQRIENGDSTPRAFTMKALADALDLKLEDLTEQQENLISPTNASDTYDRDEEKQFLKTICLSCFSYLIVPVVHFFVPAFLLKKSKNHHVKTIAFCRTMIRQQIYWVVILCLVLMLTLAYNFMMAIYFNKQYLLHFLLPFFIMYFLNVFIILKNFREINKLWPGTPVTS